jgi:D-3-phosphoglycerate dehydrogenase
MLALVSARLTEDAQGVLESEFGWSLLRATVAHGRISLEAVRADEVGALVVEAEPVDPDLLAALPALRLIACLRGNPVNVDVAEATDRGIPVLFAPARNAEAVAEFVLGLVFSSLRNIAEAHHLIRTGELTEDREVEVRERADVIWRPSDPARPIPYHVFRGPELCSQVVGLVGFGAIGRRVAAKLLPLAKAVLACDPNVADEEILAAGCTPRPLAELLAEADIVSLHARGSGAPIIGREELGAMKHGARLVNTARANLLDYDALVEALVDGHLAAAALDVFPDEPLSSSSRLLSLPNVTLTPHIAGASSNVIDHQSKILLDSLRVLLGNENRSSLAVRNREVLEAWRADGSPAGKT